MKIFKHYYIGVHHVFEQFTPRETRGVYHKVFESPLESPTEEEWKEALGNPGCIYPVPNDDAGLKLWCVSVFPASTYFAYARDEKEAEKLARNYLNSFGLANDIMGVFNFNNQWAVGELKYFSTEAPE